MAITINGDGSITGLSAGGLPNDSVTLANLAHGTDGQIITYDASGAPTALGPGSDGQVLTSTGSGSPPAFEAVPAGGKVLQHVWTANRTARTSTATSPADSTFGVCSITPTKATSIIVVQFNVCVHYSNAANSYMQLYFDTASSGYGTVPNVDANNGFNRLTNYNNNMSYHTGFRYDHDHNVTTELNYKVYWASSDGSNTMTLNYDGTYGMLSATEYDVTGDGQ